jgi:hypothetical protein
MKMDIRLVAACVLLATLSACGGGGGGGSKSSSFRITLDKSSVNFDVTIGQASPTQTVIATATGTAPDSLYVGAIAQGQGIDPAITVLIDGMQATIVMHAASNLPEGDYSGTVLFLACTDQACNNRVGGTPLPVAYTVKVHPPLGFSSAQTQLSSALGNTASAPVTVRFSQSNATFNATVTGAPDWLTISNQTTSGFQLNARALPPGQYLATVEAAAGTEKYQMTVYYNVAAAPGLTLTAVSGQSATGQLPAPLAPGAATYTSRVTQGAEWLSITQQTPGIVQIAARSLPESQYAGSVEITSGSTTFTQNIAYNVSAPASGHQELVVAPTNLALMAVEGAASSSATLTITAPSWNPPIAISSEYGSGATDWLTITTTSTGYTITANAASLHAGTYTATLHVDSGWPRGTTFVPVALTVGVGLARPADVVVPVHAQTTLAQLSGAVDINVVDGPPVAWAATDDAPWLTLTRTSGMTGTQLQYTIDRTLLDSLTNFHQHTATVTIVPGVGSMSPVSFSIEADKKVAEVTGLGPFYLHSNQVNKLIIRGRGFGDVANIASSLIIDGATASNARFVNDTEIVVDVNSLPVGSYAVHFNNVLGLTTAQRSFQTLAPRTLSYQIVPTGGRLNALIYDDARAALFAANSNLELLQRFRWDGSNWTVDSISIPQATNVGLLELGQSVMVTALDGSIRLVDPDTLGVKSTFTSTTGVGTRHSNAIAITNDGRAFLDTASSTGLYYFDSLTDTFDTVEAHSYLTLINSVYLGVSGNGERLILPSDGGLSYGAYFMDAADSNLRLNDANIWLDLTIEVNEDGSRVGSGYGQITVHDADFGLIGNALVPSSEGNFVYRSQALSPDGTRGYILVSDPTDFDYNQEPATTHPLRVYVFDTSSRPISDPALPVLGYFELPDHPTCRMYYQCGSILTTISRDGRTLFFGGDKYMVIVPIPDEQILLPVTASAPQPKLLRVNPKSTGVAPKMVPWKLKNQ